MKKISLILMAAAAFILSACLKTEAPIPVIDPLIQLGKDTLIIKKFITDNKIPAVKDSIYGVYYQIKAPGTGNYTYNANSQVTVKYVGKFLGGEKFDEKLKDSVTYKLGSLILGWQIGIPRIQKGGKIRLFIASGYGYGSYGSQSGTIPPNAILDFDIELIDVK
jgi:FKBP-type peptidyl-prolyl cis-trans isomerase FkpA